MSNSKKEALRELAEFAQDSHRERLLEKFKVCPESSQLAELLGTALVGRSGYSQRRERARSLPVPPGLVHPG